MKYQLKFKPYALLFALFALFAMISIFSSCDKDELSQVQAENELMNMEDLNTSGENQKSLENRCDPSGIVKIGNKLSFRDMDHFRETLECLEKQLEGHLEGFDSDYANIPTDQLDSIAEHIEFDDWQPLIDFENQLGFLSRRNHIELLIIGWLDNDDLDFNNDPDDMDGLDEELRTLLNIDGEIIIGGKIYNYLDEEKLGQTKTEDCKTYRKNKDDYPYDGNKQFKLKIVLSSPPFKLKQKVKVVNFKKRRRRGWKRSRTELIVQVGGSIRDEDCNFPLNYGASNSGRRKSLKATRVTWDPPTRGEYKEDEGTASCVVGDGWTGFIRV